MKKLSLLALLGVLSVLSLPARAQWTVIDPANLAQNTMTAARTLQQINNQIQQLANEAQMLSNEARNLNPLNFSVLAQLRATLAAADQLIAQAQGLAFNVPGARQQFAQFYPVAYGGAATSAQLGGDQLKRWSNSLEALRTAVSVQSQAIQNFSSDEAALGSLVGSSQAATGALQATQATNQLLALQSRQAIQEQQLRVAQDRASALEQARAVAAEATSRIERQQFMGQGATYTPQTVHFYGP